MHYCSLGLVLSIVGMLIFTTSVLLWNTGVSAQAPAPLEFGGYLWSGTQNAGDGSSQGLGWISLRSDATGPAYGVTITPSPDRELVGYAWIGGGVDSLGSSVPGGFVKFGDLSNCPSGGNCDARVVGSDSGNTGAGAVSGYSLAGWAQACSVYSDPADCGSGVVTDYKPDIERGGWDGWISLNCVNDGTCGTVDYAVEINNNGTFRPNSFAWGSDVLGQISFSRALFTPSCSVSTSCISSTESRYRNMWCEETDTTCPAGTVCVGSGVCEVPPAVTGDIIFERPFARPGETVRVQWTASVPDSQCHLESSAGDYLAVNGGMSQPIGTNAVTYRLFCEPAVGSPAVEVTSEILNVIATVRES